MVCPGIISRTRLTAPTARLAAAREKNLAGVAPAVITTAWFDPLRDEGRRLCRRAVNAGVPVKYHPGEV